LLGFFGLLGFLCGILRMAHGYFLRINLDVIFYALQVWLNSYRYPQVFVDNLCDVMTFAVKSGWCLIIGFLID
jgi:hypothetical protein